MSDNLKENLSIIEGHPFQAWEFNCKCGTNCGTGLGQMKPTTLRKLVRARQLAGVPFSITSAYRCPEHRLTKVHPNRAHPKGHAVDIAVGNSDTAFRIVKALFDAGFKRIGWNQEKKFVHADDDPSLPSPRLFPY